MMRKNQYVLYAILICVVTFGCGSSRSNAETTSDNKSDSTVAVYEYIPLADPFILHHGDTFYAYGTSSDNGFEVFYSDNLQTWKKHDQMLLKKEDSFGEKWFWAPEVYYNASNNKFYLFYSAEEHICVATADSPLGPFRQKDKKPMRPEKGIDSSLFIDEDGKAYVYFVRFTDGNVIWVAELEDDWETIKEETLTQCIAASSQGWESMLGKVVEGASVIKHDGLYYLLYSGNDFHSPDYAVGYATAPTPRGPWTKNESNPILRRPQKGLVGTGHGAYFQDKDKRYKYVFHAHHDSSRVHPRLMHIIDMQIEDSKISMDTSTVMSPKYSLITQE